MLSNVVHTHTVHPVIQHLIKVNRSVLYWSTVAWQGDENVNLIVKIAVTNIAMIMSSKITNEMPKTGDDSTWAAMLMMFDDKLCTDKGEIMIDADDKLMKTFGAKYLVMLRPSWC